MGVAGVSLLRGSGGGWGLEPMTWEKKQSAQGLFRSEAVGSGDLDAVQPPKWQVTEKTEMDCPPRHVA